MHEKRSTPEESTPGTPLSRSGTTFKAQLTAISSSAVDKDAHITITQTGVDFQGATLHNPSFQMQQPPRPPLTACNLPTGNRYYVNRPTLFAEISQQLKAKQGQKQVILSTHGLGGVGKTALAEHYLLHSGGTYSFCARFHAGSLSDV